MYFEITHVLLLPLSRLFRGFSVFFKASFLCLVRVAIRVPATSLFASGGIGKHRVLHVVNVILRLPFVLALVWLVRQEFCFLAGGHDAFGFFLFLFFFFLFRSSLICQGISFRSASWAASGFRSNFCSGSSISSRFLLFCRFFEKVAITFSLRRSWFSLFLVGAVTLLTVALMTVGFFLDRYHWIIEPRIFLRLWGSKSVALLVFPCWAEEFSIGIGAAVGTSEEFSENVLSKSVRILIQRLPKHHTIPASEERVRDVLAALTT